MRPNAVELQEIYKQAHKAVSLVGASCEQCGSTTRLHRHHPDYSRPTDVQILCVLCHNVLHSKANRERRLAEESLVDFMDAKELKQRRKALGFTVPALAEKLGVTRITLYRWEREGVRERVAMLRLALLALEMLQVRSPGFEPKDQHDE